MLGSLFCLGRNRDPCLTFTDRHCVRSASSCVSNASRTKPVTAKRIGIRSRSFAKRFRILFCGFSCGAGRNLRPFEKERQPSFPCALCPHTLKQIVVPVSVCLEVEAEVQKRLPQGPFRAK
jgi:hypothetical protein